MRTPSLLSLLVLAVATALADDGPPMSKEESRKAQIEYHRKAYSDSANQAPTTENILASIRHRNPTGERYVETLWALALVAAGGVADERLERALLDCLKAAPSAGIKVASAQALLTVNPEVALPLTRQIVDDDQISLRDKLELARVLLEQGHLFGYRLLLGASTSDQRDVRSRAWFIVEAYRPFNGKPWGDGPEWIDVDLIKARTKKDVDAIFEGVRRDMEDADRKRRESK